MRYRVIISHDQTESIREFPCGCPSVFVFDSPTYGDLTECALNGHEFTVMPLAGNRSANRNAGLAYMMSKYQLSDDDIVEFFDGDRYPVKYDRDIIDRALSDADVLLYTCPKDARLSLITVPETGYAVCDTGRLCNPFYSCGFAIRVSAIKKIMEFNGGYLFMPSFTRWGCEDQYLGVECANLGIPVAITREVVLNGQVGGDSGMHFDYRDALQQYIDLLMANGLKFT